jgi:hypothetical protein
VQYFALWQSLVGALGAFAVASFTVWKSNKHASDREERQARRAKMAERQAMLRDKLESLVTSCEASYRNILTSTQHLAGMVDATLKKRALPVPSSDDSSFTQNVSAAVVVARIYFPSLAEMIYEFHRKLRDHGTLASDLARAAMADNAIAFERPDIAEVKALRFAILDEARRLIANNFDLKDE